MFDEAVIGGGRAGLAAVISAYDNGVKDVLVVEREEKLGDSQSMYSQRV